MIKHGQNDKIDKKREKKFYNQKVWSFRPKINAKSKNICEQTSEVFEDDVVTDEHSNNELVESLTNWFL